MPCEAHRRLAQGLGQRGTGTEHARAARVCGAGFRQRKPALARRALLGPLAIYELPRAWLGATPGLSAPRRNLELEPGGEIALQGADAGIAAARYFYRTPAGDFPLAAAAQGPHALRAPVPANVGNGRSFQLLAEVETLDGEIVQAAPRQLVVRGNELPANPFVVAVSTRDAYLPRPLEIRATVSASRYPVQQVEFYYAPAAAGPYELIGRHAGPEYLMHRNFGLEQSGHFLKVRAVDRHGNVAESEPVSFQRRTDAQPPQASVSFGGTLVSGAPVGGHQYQVLVDSSDADSGVELVLLEREGRIIAVGTGPGTLVAAQAPPHDGEAIALRARVFDRSGNERVVEAQRVAVADEPPALAELVAPERIREQDDFTVRLRVDDDLTLSRTEIVWRGRVHAIDARAGEPVELGLRDERALRVTAPLQETLELRAHDSLGQVVSATRTYEYDPENRLTRSCNANHECISTRYDATGNRIAHVLPKGNQTLWEYDLLGRLVATQTPSGRTTFEYDPAGNRIATTDALGSRTTARFDALNRRTQDTIVKAEGALTTSYEYDEAGNQVAMTDAKGQRITYAYDPLNRLTASVIPAQSGIQAVQVTGIAYQYDNNDNLTQITETKRRPDASTFTDLTQSAYDALNRLTQHNQRGTPVTYAYDAAGNRTAVTSPLGTTAITYNERNWPAEVSGSTFRYFPDGKPEQISHANGTAAKYQYDAANRITQLTHEKDSTPLLDLRYQYDQNGNRTQLTEAKPGSTRTTTYAYDDSDRLIEQQIEADGPQKDIAYVLDAVGNRTREITSQNGSVVTTTYRYDSSHWLTERTVDQGPNAGTTNYAYDQNGNLQTKSVIPANAGIQGSQTEYIYDAKDQLLSVQSQNSVIATYDYDWRGLRIRKNTAQGTTQTIYDGMKVLEEHSTQATRYRHAPTRHASLLAVESGGATQTAHLDGLGSTMVLSGHDGNEAASYTIDAWGKVEAQTGATTNSLTFTGHRTDNETGLVYMNARYYDPELGRFISRDPAKGNPKDPASMHPYLYAFANPGTWVDPTGQFNELGHYYTTFYVALGLRYADEEAGYMAYFSQAPDEIGYYDAINQVVHYCKLAGGVYLATGVKASCTSPSGRLEDVQRKLHALMGGDADTQSRRTADLIKKVRPEAWDEPVEAPRLRLIVETTNLGHPGVKPKFSIAKLAYLGLLIHRLGDTYAHRRMDDPTQLYEAPFGHGDDHTHPDELYRRPELYSQFLDALASSLNAVNANAGRRPMSQSDIRQYATTPLKQIANDAAQVYQRAKQNHAQCSANAQINRGVSRTTCNPDELADSALSQAFASEMQLDHTFDPTSGKSSAHLDYDTEVSQNIKNFERKLGDYGSGVAEHEVQRAIAGAYWQLIPQIH